MNFKTEILSYTLISSLEIIFFSAYFSILGASFYSFFYKEKIKINDFIKLNIVGIFALYIFTSIWNIFLPINKYTFLITLIPIASFVSKNFWKSITQLKSVLNRQSFFFVISIFITLIWVSNIGIGPLQYEPQYHLQKIRWSQQFALTPGLANLYNHYGFDSSFFCFIAFFDNIFKYSMWNISGYLKLTCIVYFLLIPIQTIHFNKNAIKGSYIMRIFFTPIIIYYCFYYKGSSTDLFASFFGIILAINMYKILIEKQDDYVQLLMLLVLGFSAKMTFLPIVVSSIIVLLSFKNKILLDFFFKRKIVTLVFIFGFSLQIFRNIILTGYPFYPKDFIPVPVIWKIPKDKIEWLNNAMSQWPVGSPKTNKNYINDKKEWLRTRFFIQHRKVETLYPVMLGILGLVSILKKREKTLLKNFFLFSIPAIGQIIFFFLIATDNRFANFAFWWLGAGFISLPVKQLIFDKRENLVFLTMLIILFSFGLHSFDRLGRVMPIINKNNLITQVKSPRYDIFETRAGLKLNVPKNNEYCHDCPLPCTTSPNHNLRLIDEKRLDKGFYFDQTEILDQ